MVDIQFVVEKRQCEMAVNAAIASVSPISMAEFLRTDGHAAVRERMNARFKQEGDDASGPWAPLAYATQQFRRSLGLGDQHPINVRTGEFLNWLRTEQPDVIAGAGNASYSFPGQAPADAQILKKFTTSQKGGPKKSTPARPALAINETDTALITARLEYWVRRRMGTYSI